ncbi:UDP-N-acetylenolpyruvoylglucosamine reductase [Bienertia sinuspersici]
MGFGTLRSFLRPISRAISTHSSNFLTQSPQSSAQFLPKSLLPFHQLHQQQLIFGHLFSRSVHLESLSSLAPKPFDPLTNTRFPKRRPLDKPRRKRSSLRPSGPYAWVKHEPGRLFHQVSLMRGVSS